MSQNGFRYEEIRRIEEQVVGDNYFGDQYDLDAGWTVTQLEQLHPDVMMWGHSTVSGLPLLDILVQSVRPFSAMKLLFLRLSETLRRGLEESYVSQVVEDIKKVWPIFYGENVWYTKYLEIDDIDDLSMYELYKKFGVSDVGISKKVKEILKGIDVYFYRKTTGSRLFDNTTTSA